MTSGKRPPPVSAYGRFDCIKWAHSMARLEIHVCPTSHTLVKSSLTGAKRKLALPVHPKGAYICTYSAGNGQIYIYVINWPNGLIIELTLRHGSHLANLCQNLFTLRWRSVITGLCLVRPQVFPFGKNFAKWQNIKDAVVLGWGRQIFEKSSQTMGITAATVNACQCNMKNDTRGKFNSSSRS